MKSRRWRREEREVTAWAEFGLMLLTLKIEEGDHEPRNVGSLRKLEKVRKPILLWSLHKEGKPAGTLFLGQ